MPGCIHGLGLKYGRTEVEDKQAGEKINELINEFVQRLQSRNGSIVCKALLDCDIGTPEGCQAVQEKKRFRDFYPKMVKDAAEVLEEIL